MKYDLTDDDLAYGAFVAETRMTVAREKGYVHVAGLVCDEDENEDIDLIGALGEIAFARMFGEEPQCDFDACKEADHTDRWGTGWHIRSTRRKDGCLIARKHDKYDGKYVLMTVDPEARNVRLVGWHEGKKIPRLHRLTRKGTNRTPAYFVSQRFLSMIENYLDDVENTN